MRAAVAARAASIPVVRRIRPGMEANALILMLSSVLTGALGVVYWVVAERLFPTDQVGQAATLISTATMLSSLACLSLGGSYQRFLPVAGSRTRLLVGAGLAITGVVALAFGAGFVLVGASREELFDDRMQQWLFPLVVAILTAYALLDQILIGLRRAGTVAVKNISLSVAKIAPLPLLTVAASGFWIAGSWAALALLVTVAILIPLFRRGMAGLRDVPPRLPPVTQLWAFQGASLTLMLVQIAAPLCLPLIILSQLGASSSAYYNLIASLTVAVGVLRSNVLASYIVEASAPGADRARLTDRMMRLMLTVCVCCAAGLAVIGPLLLRVAGADYARAATSLALVMAVEAIAAVVPTIFAGAAFVERRLRLLIAVQVVVVGTTLLGAYVLLPRVGLVGVGIAALSAQAIATVAVAIPLRHQLRRFRADAAAV